MNRIKLFSSSGRKRVSLFSNPEVSKVSVVCSDCGYEMKTTNRTLNIICPECGGTRFYPAEYFVDETEEELEEDTPTIKKLKTYSGQELLPGEYKRLFGEDLVEKGFAEVLGNGNYKISDNAHYQAKLFSKLTITITRELDLDPEVVGCKRDIEKEGIIDSLTGRIPEKGIMLLKKAEGIDPNKGWLEDSGILQDLRYDFGGTQQPMSGFKRIIISRYPDAPENIMDILKNRGVIGFSNGMVDIF